MLKTADRKSCGLRYGLKTTNQWEAQRCRFDFQLMIARQSKIGNRQSAIPGFRLTKE
jgi:hypothetical protein